MTFSAARGATSVALLLFSSVVLLAPHRARAQAIDSSLPLFAERAVARSERAHRPVIDHDGVVLGPDRARVDASGLRVGPVSIALSSVGRASVGRASVGHASVGRASVGRRGTLLALRSPEQIRIDGPEVRLERAPGLVEWWRSLSSGLEHGVSLATRPEGEGLLTLEMTVGDGVHVAADSGGVRLVDARGRSLAHYGGLAVVDATGRRVPATLTEESGRIRLEVNDEGARYPLLIDPVLALVAAPEAAITLTNCGTVLDVAITDAGDRIFVGCADGTDSTIRVFDRSGTTWVEGTGWTGTVPDENIGTHIAIDADATRVAIGTDPGETRIYRESAGGYVLELTSPSPPRVLAMSPDGSRVVMQRFGVEMFVRSGTTWAPDASFSAPLGVTAARTLAFSPDGARLFVGGMGGGSVMARTGSTWSAESLPNIATMLDGAAMTNDRVFVDGIVFDRVLGTWTEHARASSCGGGGFGRLSISADGALVVGRCALTTSSPGSRDYVPLESPAAGSVVGRAARDGLRYVAVTSGPALPTVLTVRRTTPARAEGAACATDGECVFGRCVSSICCGGCGAVAMGACGALGAGTECRAPALALVGCDPPEVCDGVETGCPIDRLLSRGAACDVANTCVRAGTGTCGNMASGGRELMCEGGMPEPAGTTCRASAGDCDGAEACNGTSLACPTEAFLTGVECRPGAGECDSPEVCFGTSASCPPDLVEAAGMPCRVSIDLSCDPTESCDGTATTCAADVNACVADPDAGAGADTGPAPTAATAGCACRASTSSAAPTCFAWLVVCALGVVIRRRHRRTRDPSGRGHPLDVHGRARTPQNEALLPAARSARRCVNPSRPLCSGTRARSSRRSRRTSPRVAQRPPRTCRGTDTTSSRFLR